MEVTMNELNRWCSLGMVQIIQRYLWLTQRADEARQDPKSIFSLDNQWRQTKDELKV